jgi:hypothetical protein
VEIFAQPLVWWALRDSLKARHSYGFNARPACARGALRSVGVFEGYSFQTRSPTLTDLRDR